MPNHQFFNTDNAEGMRIRNQVCQDALEDMFSWMDVKGEVCLLDLLDSLSSLCKKLVLCSFNTY